MPRLPKIKSKRKKHTHHFCYHLAGNAGTKRPGRSERGRRPTRARAATVRREPQGSRRRPSPRRRNRCQISGRTARRYRRQVRGHPALPRAFARHRAERTQRRRQARGDDPSDRRATMVSSSFSERRARALKTWEKVIEAHEQRRSDRSDGHASRQGRRSRRPRHARLRAGIADPPSTRRQSRRTRRQEPAPQGHRPRSQAPSRRALAAPSSRRRAQRRRSKSCSARCRSARSAKASSCGSPSSARSSTSAASTASSTTANSRTRGSSIRREVVKIGDIGFGRSDEVRSRGEEGLALAQARAARPVGRARRQALFEGNKLDRASRQGHAELSPRRDRSGRARDGSEGRVRYGEAVLARAKTSRSRCSRSTRARAGSPVRSSTSPTSRRTNSPSSFPKMRSARWARNSLHPSNRRGRREERGRHNAFPFLTPARAHRLDGRDRIGKERGRRGVARTGRDDHRQRSARARSHRSRYRAA